MRFKCTGLLHCSTDTNHSCMDNWRKLQTSRWRLSAESIEIIVQTALILYQLPSLRSSKGLVTPYMEGHYIGQSFLHLAKMQVGRCICHFDKTTPTKVDIEVLLSKHLKGIFQWMYMVRARAHLQNTTNSLLHVRHYQLCLLSFNTSVSQYFLFYIFRLRQGLWSAKNTYDGSYARDMLYAVQLWSVIFPYSLCEGLRLVSHNMENMAGKQAKSGVK